MIGPILLFVSWVLLRWEHKGLGTLGFNFPRIRSCEFALGLLVTGMAAAIQQIGSSYATNDAWRLNSSLSFGLVVTQLRWTLNSVLFEELLFRGYLLYQAIRFLGPRRGVWLSAVAFGIYHWFTFGVLGNPVAMIYVFLLTGAFGGLCAFAFAETKSIVAPIGLHLGWNLVSYVIFSAGPSGASILIPASGVARMKAIGLPGLALGLGLQLTLVALVILALLRRRSRLAPVA
ncbi:lysostaphin resistance A-like protein [Oleiharenicola lentus]|uniref:CPBP family intramembrane glutamic endopeptidase n=1 Tax=Oleiharenicola lentus TaxID=2508720 RepID=UPI003F661576